MTLIESDGGVSSVPALAGEMVTVYGPSTAYGSSSLYGPSVVYGSPTIYGPSSVYSKPISYIYSWNKGWVQNTIDIKVYFNIYENTYKFPKQCWQLTFILNKCC